MTGEIKNTVSPTINATISGSIVNCIPRQVLQHLSNTNNPHNVTCSQIGAMPYNKNIVSDGDYVHTDNNFTSEYKSTLDTISQNYASSSKINELTTAITSLQSTTTNTATACNNNTSAIASLSSDIADVNADITSLQSTTADTSTKVTSNSNTIETLKTNIDTLQTTSASNTQAITSLSSNKVDKIAGKGLSTEDFTTELKTKLISLESGGSGSTSNTINKNYLYNQQFSINQRNKSKYTVGTTASYCLDRWQKDANTEVTYNALTGVVTLSNLSTTDMEGIGQYIFDHSAIVSNQVTFCLKTSTSSYTLTSDTLPAEPEKTHKDTILKTVETDFGKIQLQFVKKHFLVKILLNTATSNTEYTTITLVSAKLEKGTTYTGIEPQNKVLDTAECAHFYQKLANRSACTPTFVTYKPAKTEYNMMIPLSNNLYMTTLTIVNEKDTNVPKVVKLDGETVSLSGYKTMSVKYKDSDQSYIQLYIDFVADNSTLLGDKTSMTELCFGTMPGYGIEAEITT